MWMIVESIGWFEHKQVKMETVKKSKIWIKILRNTRDESQAISLFDEQ